MRRRVIDTFNKCAFITVFCCLLLSVATAFADEKFPFMAEVSSSGVNIRAGQHLNFEKLCRLNKGDQVIVVARSYSWYKIKLPLGSKSFISQNYVQLTDDKTGTVSANRVNVRAGPDPNTTALGQLKKGAGVKILEKLPGWYRIEPVDETYGWVSDQYLTFKSNSIPAVINPPAQTPPNPPPVALPVAPSPPVAPISSEAKETITSEKVLIPATSNAVFVSGRIAVLEDPKAAGDIHYKLIIDNQTAYYLEAGKKNMDEFVPYQVMVEGAMKEDLLHLYLYPVIVISRIHLVL